MKGVISKSAIIMAIVFLFTTAFAIEPADAKDTDATTDIYTLITQRDDLSTFAEIVSTAKMDAPLQNEGPYTVLAPTNSAFEALNPDMVEQWKTDPVAAQDFVSAHLIQDSLGTEDIQAMDKVETLTGEEVAVTTSGGIETVGGAEVIEGDLNAKNGVVYIMSSSVNGFGKVAVETQDTDVK